MIRFFEDFLMTTKVYLKICDFDISAVVVPQKNLGISRADITNVLYKF